LVGFTAKTIIGRVQRFADELDLVEICAAWAAGEHVELYEEPRPQVRPLVYRFA